MYLQYAYDLRACPLRPCAALAQRSKLRWTGRRVVVRHLLQGADGEGDRRYGRMPGTGARASAVCRIRVGAASAMARQGRTASRLRVGVFRATRSERRSARPFSCRPFKSTDRIDVARGTPEMAPIPVQPYPQGPAYMPTPPAGPWTASACIACRCRSRARPRCPAPRPRPAPPSTPPRCCLIR